MTARLLIVKQIPGAIRFNFAQLLFSQTLTFQVMQELFTSDPIEYALTMIDEGRTDKSELLTACLKWMSHDQIRDMLESNELDPRACEAFDEGYCTDEISKEERFGCEMYNERYSYCD